MNQELFGIALEKGQVASIDELKAETKVSEAVA
jgi:hypothetical protein